MWGGGCSETDKLANEVRGVEGSFVSALECFGMASDTL